MAEADTAYAGCKRCVVDVANANRGRITFDFSTVRAIVDAAPLVFPGRHEGFVLLPAAWSEDAPVRLRTAGLERARLAVGEGPHDADDMGRVGPLPPVLGQKALFTAQDEQRIQEQALGASFHETAAELAQHGGVKSGAFQIIYKNILPIFPTADSIHGASIRKFLAGLQQIHRGKPPEALRRLAIFGKERDELLVTEIGPSRSWSRRHAVP